MFGQLVQLVYSAQPDNISVYDRSCLPLSLTGLYLKMNGFELFHITCSRKDSRKLLNNNLIQFLVGLISTTVTNSKKQKDSEKCSFRTVFSSPEHNDVSAKC